jgi:rod shape determining protein RodA
MESQALPRTLRARERAGVIERIGITHLDPGLIVGAIALLACSLYTLHVTTSADIPHDPNFYVVRQAIYGAVGIACMLALSRIDYSRFRELRVGLYTAMIAAILLVYAAGTATRGSKRSLDLPFFSLQTSELGKLLLILALAAFAIDQGRRLGERQRTARILVMGLFPAMLVFAQPDLGTAGVYVAITFAILFISGTPWTHFAFIGGLAVSAVTLILVIAPAVGHPILPGYQQERLTSFLSPSSDPKDSSYQTHQSIIAIGSGGKTGRGSDATQTENGFLPERQTDFIFAAVGERFGFLGAAFVLSLYALLMWRALRIMTLAKNLYGSLIAGGIAAMFMFHVFVNVGITIGIMPVTGIPLPLMSFGGSSVVVTLMAIGLLQSVYVQARLSPRAGPSRYV